MSEEKTGSPHHHGEHDHTKCVELAERISEYVDLELPPELRAHVEAHLHGCVNCEKFVESVRRTKNLAHLLPRLEMPADRMRALADKVRHEVDG